MTWRLAILAGLAALALTLLKDRAPEPAPPPATELPAAVIETAGDHLPPAGRSLFDFLLAEHGSVPFPFVELIKAIERHSPMPKIVLIPFGRSLQRTASAPDFFAYPRVVLAADAEAGGLMLKDRLFLGYNEKTEMIEVISYNESAGRFEFQVVKDYREGGERKVLYANRAVCVACHQNAGPIFSRALWDETSANPRLAAKLSEARRDFYGVSAESGVDTPNAIDDATDRANLFALYQVLWREGCASDACRGDLLLTLLRTRLSGKTDARKWREEWRARWPQGVALANPDIPNRDPLLDANTKPHEISADMDALNPRAPLAIWFADQGSEQALAGFSELISLSDIVTLDRWLATLRVDVTRHESDCEFSQSGDALDFECKGEFAATGRVHLEHGKVRKGRVDRLVLNGDELRELRVEGDSPDRMRLQRGKLNARLADGGAIEQLLFSRPGGESFTAGGEPKKFSGAAVLTLRDDFSFVRKAASQLVERKDESLSNKPFRPGRVIPALFSVLGMPAPKQCCDAELPAPALDPIRGGVHPADAAAQGFVRWCASCHNSNDRFPPNFLTGAKIEVHKKLDHCAERIYVRLAMHGVPEHERAKTPMPPATARSGFEAAELAPLREYAGGLIKSRRGRLPALDELLFHGYESLQECLPS